MREETETRDFKCLKSIRRSNASSLEAVEQRVLKTFGHGGGVSDFKLVKESQRAEVEESKDYERS